MAEPQVDQPEVEPFDSNNPSHVAKRLSKAKILEKKRINAVQNIMSTPDGRYWMWDFLSNCGLYACSVSEPTTMAFKEGMRNVGLRVFLEVQRYAPEMYAQMTKEAQQGDGNAT